MGEGRGGDRALDAEVGVVGGCGRAGLPLALAFSFAGLRTIALDSDVERVRQVTAGEMPFLEEGATAALRRALVSEGFQATTDARALRRVENVVIVIGTPVDEFLSPSMSGFDRAVAEVRPHIRDGALVVLRSTMYPGTTERLGRVLSEDGSDVDVGMCPERIVEGRALSPRGADQRITPGAVPRMRGAA